MSLIDYVLENADNTEYYKELFPNWDGNHNTNVKCPFHNDNGRPNLSINIKKSGGAFCHSCSTKVGSIIHFEKLANKLSDDEEAASAIYGRLFRPIIASQSNAGAYCAKFQTSLKGAPKILEVTKNELQISEETIKRFCLGWTATTRRIAIPVFDIFGQLANIRLYRLPSMREGENFPKILNTDGYGSPASIFPAPILTSLCSGKHKPNVVYWFSGERDTLLAWDRGIPSFCYTTGENVCKKEWAEEIKSLECTIGIVADNDKTGLEGAKKRLKLLKDNGIEAFLVQLPDELQKKKVKDFSDFISNGGSVKTFLALGDAKKHETKPQSKAPEPESPFEESEEEEDSEYYPIPRITNPARNPFAGQFHVAQIGRTPELLNRPIEVKAIVSGKVDRTYSVPRVVEVGDNKYEIPISREMLQLVRENDVAIVKLIRAWLNTRVDVKIISHLTVTECEIIPMIQPGIDVPYVNQKCYFFGDYLECNKPYLMRIIPTTDMNTQETIGLIVAIKPVSNVLDTYKFDDRSMRMLAEEFAIGETDSFESLRQLAHSVAVNHTHIYNRDDLHLCGLLSWISPLQFEFPCEGIQRGWLNTLILGDTETGKSRVCQKLTSLFQCGVFINAESCSYVGLVGGAVKSSSGMFILRWGKIPLYNRQLVVVEELSGLDTQEISYMSEIRSAGVARYDKAGLTGEVSAKTRLICLSNVRGAGKSLADYNTGVQAAQQLVGQNEDLARFDLILTVTDDEVDGKIINSDRSNGELKLFSPEEKKAFKELVMFAWSLKPEQIDFTVGAYRACLMQTMKMCGEYHASLPVFKSGSGRLKLARIALAIACIQFNWNFEQKKLVVTAKHVDCAAKVLHTLFHKPSFGYARYSKIQYNLQKVLQGEEVTIRIRDTFKEKELDFLMYLSNSLSFTKFDVSEAMGEHHIYIERCISQMFISNLLKKGEHRSEWQLSRAGRKWVEKRITEKSAI